MLRMLLTKLNHIQTQLEVMQRRERNGESALMRQKAYLIEMQQFFATKISRAGPAGRVLDDLWNGLCLGERQWDDIQVYRDFKRTSLDLPPISDCMYVTNICYIYHSLFFALAGFFVW